MSSKEEDHGSSSCCAVDDRRIPAVVLDNFLRAVFQPPVRFLSRFVATGQTVADLGCGPGFYAIPSAKIVGPHGRVFAVDFDGNAVVHVTRKAAKRGVTTQLEAHEASAAALTFIDAKSVDFVLAEGLLCCMTDHAGAMREIARVLKPGGRAYLSVIKFSNRNDPRTVSGDEWKVLLGSMRVLEEGERLASRWALVASR